MKRLLILQFMAAIVLVLIGYQPVMAHKVRIFAWQDAGSIITESKFSGGRAAQQVTVSVVDMDSGSQLLSGTTDTDGLFSFPIPDSGAKKLEIIVDGGDGHKNSWKFELEESSPTDTRPQPHIEGQAEEQVELQSTVDKPDDNVSAPIDSEELTRLIEEVMDRKLAPIRRSLAENSEKGPTIQDILSGIGYILGLAGIAAYMQSLRNKKE